MDAAFRIQAALHDRRARTLVGNWVHSFPDDAYPGPNLDWLHEMVRFFDRYLKGIDNGWEREPALVWFEREYAEPEPFPAACRAAGGRRPRPASVGRGTAGVAGASCRWSGRETLGPAPTSDRVALPPPRHRRDRAALSWGAGGTRTASPATCARTRCAG